MCDHESGFSRRTFVGMIFSLGGLLAIGGCVETPYQPIMAELPDSHEEPPHGLPALFQPTPVPVPPTPSARERIQTEAGEIMPRTAWTRSGPDTNRLRPMNGVKLITFHHSGDGKPFVADDIASVAKHLEMVRQFHRSRGFSDIGYHFAIDHAGRVWQLRSLQYEGQHVRIGRGGIRWNEHNIGVVVLGDFSKQRPSEAQRQQIVRFGSFLHRKYGLPASAVKVHQELVDTNCPGATLAPYIKQIRAIASF